MAMPRYREYEKVFSDDAIDLPASRIVRRIRVCATALGMYKYSQSLVVDVAIQAVRKYLPVALEHPTLGLVVQGPADIIQPRLSGASAWVLYFTTRQASLVKLIIPKSSFPVSVDPGGFLRRTV